LRIRYGASLARMAECSEFGWSNAHGADADDMPTHTHDIVKPQVSTTVNEKFHERRATFRTPMWKLETGCLL
jgi:hypothetical protein